MSDNKRRVRVAANKEWEFIIGAVMLVVGLWILLNKVYVSSSFFGGYIRVAGLRIRTGIFTIPMIGSLVWMFFKPQSKAPKIGVGVSFVLIIIVVICSVSIRVSAIPIATWIAILFLIAAGLGLLMQSVKISKK